MEVNDLWLKILQKSLQGSGLTSRRNRGSGPIYSRCISFIEKLNEVDTGGVLSPAAHEQQYKYILREDVVSGSISRGEGLKKCT